MSAIPGTANTSVSRKLLYYTATGLAVAALAFINGYPLVYSDSGAYMDNAFTLSAYDDRPIGYGLIIRAVTWKSTMWTVPIFQGIVVSWLLMLLVRELVQDRGRWVPAHLVGLTLLLLCSSLPWYAAQVMADIYTPLILLLLFLLFRGKRLGPWREGVLWVLLLFFVPTHNAHVFMAAAASLVLLVLGWRSRPRWARVQWLRWWGLNAALLGGVLLIMSFNRSAFGRMQFSRAGNVFLAGRLCEAGIMQDYIAHYPNAVPNPLLPYRDSLPDDAGDLLWSHDQYRAQAHLPIGEADSLLAPVVQDVLKRPRYLAWFMGNSLLNASVQLCQFEAGAGLDEYKEGSAPRAFLTDHLPLELNRYDHTRQQWGSYHDREATNRRIGITLVLSLLVLALHWWADRREGRTATGSFARWAAGWVVLNALVTATLSVIDARLQARVLWLLPLAAFLALWEVRSWRRFFNLRPEKDGPSASL